jgi:hypothetical protein
MVSPIAACAGPPAKIPSASASPSAAATTIAPGVKVSPSQLRLPPYTVSTTNPLPSGISPKQVVMDLVADNLIENLAIERREAQLLLFADTGAMLEIDQTTIATDKADGVRILSIDDSISSLALGEKADPNVASAQIALILEGTEVLETLHEDGKKSHSVDYFHVLIWVLWSPTLQRYLRCDVSDL